MKFVDPKNDIAFRKIFGDENKKEILISFLNSILGFTGTDKEITGISIQNPYQVPKLKGLKETILDIKARDKRGIHYIIEMQVFHSTAFEKRVLYYVSKAYYQQLKKADDYPKLNQVLFLGFMNFEMFKGIDSYTSRHLLLEEKTNGHYLKDFELNFVELPKFKVPLEELRDIKEKWLYFIKNAAEMEVIPQELREPAELRQAFETANQMGWTKDELDAYENRGVLIQQELGRIQFAHEEGVRKGKLEEKHSIAYSLLKEGMAPEAIFRVTGVHIKDIEAGDNETAK